ncbi:MAG: pyruvate dehydrogenase complex E1 component subunit beta [Myxococcales bacterium]|nr:pyruvate dehydrogenase complex E1 component subunit beta [Myxococcota bacterium]MDW8284014.1 pyruvate dehydrogenase complex E1 component subunit beta [Myxococcales bacterium]
MPRMSFREALNQAMCEEMERDPNVFLMGEEVGHYQGAYKVSQGMLQRFGEKRVIDTPIAECGFVGIGIGAAMVGLRPVVELMTFNFSLVAIDQIINNAAKIRQMSGGQFKIPIVIRGPGGAATMLAAQHSQSLESFFCNTPGLKVVMPSTPADAKGLLKSAIRDDDPVIFIEAELLYSEQGEVPEGEYLIPLGRGDIKRPGTDCTVVAYSKMVRLALEAARRLDKEGISVEVIDPRTLRPLDDELIFESVRKTNRLVVVQEAPPHSSFSGEVIARVQRACFDDLDAPIERVTSLDVPMPYAGHLEAMVLPDVDRVIAAIRRTLYLE